MAQIEEVRTSAAPASLPVFSQAIKGNGMVFCSGNIGLDKDTSKLVEGGIKAQTVCLCLCLTWKLSKLITLEGANVKEP